MNTEPTYDQRDLLALIATPLAAPSHPGYFTSSPPPADWGKLQQIENAPKSLRASRANLRMTDVQLAQQMRSQARELFTLIDQACPAGREQALAKTKLEEALLWAEVSLRQ